MSNLLIRYALVLTFLDFGFAFCPDTSSECANISRSIDTSLCDLQVIKNICATTCEVEGSCSHGCSPFNYLGFFAFIFYGIVLFLLLIIAILSYSYFFDSKFLNEVSERVSFSDRKRVNHEDSSGLPMLDLNSNLRDPLNPKKSHSKAAKISSDDYDDICFNRNEPDSKAQVFPSGVIRAQHPRAIAQMSNYPASVMGYPDSDIKERIRDGHEQEEADGAEYFDINDEFFKNALIPVNDSFHSDFEPPAPYALSKKLEKHKAAKLKGKTDLKLRTQDPNHEPKKKKKRRPIQIPKDRPALKERLSSPSLLSVPNRHKSFKINHSEEQLAERQSGVNSVSDALHPHSDIQSESPELRLFREPTENSSDGKRPLTKQVDARKNGWYALGHGPTRGVTGSSASEGMESYGQLPKSFGQEDLERGEPSPSPSVIKSDIDEKVSVTAGEDLVCSNSNSSKTTRVSKETDAINDVQGNVIPVESPLKA